MSRNNDEDKRQRSVKLCQLVWDRKIDKEIGFEIRKLLEEGVLIDFQDQNRNKKTAIHLAVDKCDVICAKFLLQFKPSLEVKDEDGKTPVELATVNGDQKIFNDLINCSVDVVNESYIEVFDFQILTPEKIEATKSRPTFKVLKLTNCPSADEAFEKLNDHAYSRPLNESSHFFFIAIETKEANIDNDNGLMKKVLNLRRPMIIQLISSKSENSKIYFKDNEKDFMEITDTTQITQYEFDEAVESEEDCNMKLLVAALRSNLFGHFTGNLLDTKLNTNEDRNEAVNKFAKSNALCHRFFKLFDESLPKIDRIVATLSFEGDESLLAILDLPFEPKDEKLKLNEYQQDILNVFDSSGCNLLMMAVEQGNFEALKLLLRCGCDFNRSDNYDKRASDICWEMKAFDCLAELIEAGSPYPSNFRLNVVDKSSEAHERINEMIEVTNSFHDHIKQGEIDEVKKFIASHQRIKNAFDTNNKCALTVALQSSQVEIYSFLMSEGFQPGANDEYQSVCSESKFKNEIRNSHRKYFKEAFNEPHLKRLLKMFRLSFGSKNRVKCSTIIRRMFDELNEIDELIPILKICSLSNKLRIVFDFNCESVVDMDPSKESSSLGAVYPIDGFIYIGAKNHETESDQVIGNLIHELTHYAMKLTYGNSCKPYNVGDIASAQIFENISTETKRICETNASTDPIVTTVFSCYDGGVWHQELIVRVPHLLAHHKMNPQALEAAERNTTELFHFFREKTLKDVETQSKILLQEYFISKINNQTGIARKIEDLKVKFENVELKLNASAYVITSNAPQLTLAMLNQAFSINCPISISLEQVAIGNFLEKIARVNAKESSTALIVDCIGLTQKYPKSLCKLLKDIKNIKTIALVMNEAESSKAEENFDRVEFKTYNHKWGELTESSKVNLLNQNVIFQGVEIRLNQLVEASSKAMNFFPLVEIVGCKDFKIGKELHQTSHTFYIDRKFIKKDQIDPSKSMSRSFKDILRDKLGAMIISDEAGSGKSVTLLEIAKSLHDAYPDRWVLFVDLKRHIEKFRSIEDYEKIKTFEEFVVQNILKNEPEFAQAVFMQMFRAGKTFILFDGFDEISPNYKDLILFVLKLFEPRSGNQLFITTRPHLEADLENDLGNFVFKLEIFSEEDQKCFLKEYWQSVEFEINQEDFEVLSNRLLDKFSKILASSASLIGLPLLMRMTAEIFEDPIKENLLHKVDSLSISSVFQKFVEKHFMRWTKNENEISQSESVEFLMAGGVLEVHHNMAISHIFDDVVMSFDESDAEKISRVGLIRFDQTEKTFKFVHKIFAEYFAADFIWFHLKQKNRNPKHECSKAVEVFIEILVRHFDFDVIQNFLDQALESMNFVPSEASCKALAKSLGDVIKSKNACDFLGRSLFASREKLQILLLKIVEHIEKNLLLKMLQSKACSVDSVLLDVASRGNSAVVSILCNIIATCTDNPKEIYHDLGIFRRNVLSRAAVNKNGGVLTTLCAHLNSFLTKDEIKSMFHRKGMYGQNIISIASDNSNDEVFLELISLLPNYLSHDEIKSLLLAVDRSNHNFFHRAVIYSTNGNLKIKLDAVKSNFGKDQQKAFFYRPPTALNKMFQCAAQNRHEKIFQTLIESTRDVLSNDEIISMLEERDSNEFNVLQYVAAHGNTYVLNELNSLLRERLSDDKVRSLLLEENSRGQNCFRLAANNTELNLKIFCETIENLVPVENQARLLQQSTLEIDIISLACVNNTMEIIPVDIIRHLLMKENHGSNSFQKEAFSGDFGTWNKLISFAQARFCVDEMKSFLFCCDNAAQNCLHLAVSLNRNRNVIEAICETVKIVLSVEEQKKFVQQKVYANRNVFHLASISGMIFKCFSLYDNLSSILSKEEIKEILKQKDLAGDNILCLNRKYSMYDEASCDLMPFMKEVQTNDEIKNLLSDVDAEERNFLHCAVQFSSADEIKSSSKAIKKILSREDQKKYFGIKSPNVFHLAAKNPNSGIFSTLHECLKDLLTMNEIKSLIQEKDLKNRNTLLLICQHNTKLHISIRYLYDLVYANYDSEKRLRDFFEVLKVVCDAEHKHILTSIDNDGSNCLLLAAQFKGKLFLKELFSFIRNELNKRGLIQKCDNDGKNILTCSSFNKVPETLPFVELFVKEILTECHHHQKGTGLCPALWPAIPVRNSATSFLVSCS